MIGTRALIEINLSMIRGLYVYEFHLTSRIYWLLTAIKVQMYFKVELKHRKIANTSQITAIIRLVSYPLVGKKPTQIQTEQEKTWQTEPLAAYQSWRQNSATDTKSIFIFFSHTNHRRLLIVRITHTSTNSNFEFLKKAQCYKNAVLWTKTLHAWCTPAVSA